MRPNTRSTKAKLGPAVTRLPPNVLSLIFSHNCDQPQIPTFRKEFMAYNLWRRRSGWNFVSVASRVCRAWREPAQALLVRSVALAKIKKVEDAAKGRLLDAYPDGKITGPVADKVLRKVHGVKALLLKSMTGLTTNSVFAPDLLRSLTHLNLQVAVRVPPKKFTAIACPRTIPLKRLILGSDAQPASFLQQLFTAAKPTLIRLEVTVSPSTAPALVSTFPIVAPSITELSLSSSSAWHGRSTAAQPAFLGLLHLATKVRWLGWEFEPLGYFKAITNALPDQGARIEAISLGYIGFHQDQAFVRLVLDSGGLVNLRMVTVGPYSHLSKANKKACYERRVIFRQTD